jgi:hypothetical protein
MPNPDKPESEIEDLWYRYALSFLLKLIVRPGGQSGLELLA